MKDADLHTFSEHVQRRRRQIVADVAAALRGGDVADVADELRRRLHGTGVSDSEVADWARDISALPRAG